MIEVTLPWPPKDLSPNARVHWSQRARAAKKYKTLCWAATIAEAAKIAYEGPIHVFIDFYPPDGRHRDDDNMIAAFKAGRDGVALALGVDDKRFRIHPFVKGKAAGGMVKVRFVPYVATEDSHTDR